MNLKTYKNEKFYKIGIGNNKVYLENGPSPNTETKKGNETVSENEIIAAKKADELLQRLIKGTNEVVIQAFIDDELEPTLEKLDSKEAVVKAVENINKLFPNIIHIIEFKKFDKAQACINTLDDLKNDEIHTYLENNPTQVLSDKAWGGRMTTIKDRTESIFSENIKNIIGDKAAFMDAVKEAFNAENPDGTKELDGKLTDKEISELYDIIFEKGVAENTKEFQGLLAKASTELDATLKENKRERNKKEGIAFVEGSHIEGKYGFSTDNAAIEFMAKVLKHTAKEVEINTPKLLEKIAIIQKPTPKIKEVPLPALVQYKNIVSVKERGLGSFDSEDTAFMKNEIEATEDFYESVEDDPELQKMMKEININLSKPNFKETEFKSEVNLEKGNVTEFSFAGALRGLNTLDTPQNPDRSKKENLVKIYTDEKIQGVSFEGLRELQSLAFEKNADVVWQIQIQDPVTKKFTIHKIPLHSLIKYFQDSENNTGGKTLSPEKVAAYLNNSIIRNNRNPRRNEKKKLRTYYNVFVPEGYEGIETNTYASAEEYKEKFKDQIKTYKADVAQAKIDSAKQYQQELTVWKSKQPPKESIMAHNTQQKQLLEIGKITPQQYQTAYANLADYGYEE